MGKIWKTLLKPRAQTTWLLCFLAIIALLALGFSGQLHPIKAFLDSDRLAFTWGTVRISAYLLMKTIFIVILLFWLTGIVSGFGETRIKRIKGIKPANKMLAVKSWQILVYFFGFVIGLQVLGINIAALAVFGGAVGIGLGFGLQKITANFISGMILLFEKSIKADDVVELSDGTIGVVRRTCARYTLIGTSQGKEIMIPNEDFVTQRVTNWTYSDKKARVDITVGVSYGTDLEKAKVLILEAAKEHPLCINEPSPACFLREFADSSVNFLLLFWVADVTAGRYGPQSDVLYGIWKKFKAHNIVIPYPQREVHIISQGIKN